MLTVSIGEEWLVMAGLLGVAEWRVSGGERQKVAAQSAKMYGQLTTQLLPFASVGSTVCSLPKQPFAPWAAASQQCALIPVIKPIAVIAQMRP